MIQDENAPCECGCGNSYPLNQMVVITHNHPDQPFELVWFEHYFSLYPLQRNKEVIFWDESLRQPTMISASLRQVTPLQNTSRSSNMMVFTIGISGTITAS